MAAHRAGEKGRVKGGASRRVEAGRRASRGKLSRRRPDSVEGSDSDLSTDTPVSSTGSLFESRIKLWVSNVQGSERPDRLRALRSLRRTVCTKRGSLDREATAEVNVEAQVSPRSSAAQLYECQSYTFAAWIAPRPVC